MFLCGPPSYDIDFRSFHFGIYLLFSKIAHRWMLISYEQDKSDWLISVLTRDLNLFVVQLTALSRKRFEPCRVELHFFLPFECLVVKKLCTCYVCVCVSTVFCCSRWWLSIGCLLDLTMDETCAPWLWFLRGWCDGLMMFFLSFSQDPFSFVRVQLMLLNTLNDVDNNYVTRGRSHFTGAKVTIDFWVSCTLLISFDVG